MPELSSCYFSFQMKVGEECDELKKQNVEILESALEEQVCNIIKFSSVKVLVV